MKKKSMLAVGACSLMVLGTVVPATTASAAGKMKGSLCADGTFHVLHNDIINGSRFKEGYYLTYVKKNRISCYQASTYFHEWLATGYTTDNYLVAAGTRGKKSKMFSHGQGGGAWFQVKRVANPS